MGKMKRRRKKEKGKEENGMREMQRKGNKIRSHYDPWCAVLIWQSICDVAAAQSFRLVHVWIIDRVSPVPLQREIKGWSCHLRGNWYGD